MKIEEYDCVKIKRAAQKRIYADTKDMTPEQLVTYYNRVGATLHKRQIEPHGEGALPKSDS